MTALILLAVGIGVYSLAVKFKPTWHYDEVHHHIYMFYNSGEKYSNKRDFIKLL